MFTPAPAPSVATDPSIDDVSNRWLIHPVARRLTPAAVRLGISANAVSMTGLGFGFLAALAYSRWQEPAWAVAGFMLMVAWHVCDGMDGMIARATDSASEAGRLLDGLCDYTTFILVYLVLCATLPWDEPIESYWVGIAAGALHLVQAALYEGARERHHRRLRGEAPPPWQPTRFGGALEGLYIRVNGWASKPARMIDGALTGALPPPSLRSAYIETAVPWLRFMTLLSANWRTLAIFIACLAGKPAWFWWWEVVVLTPVTVIGLVGLWSVDRRLVHRFRAESAPAR